MSGETVIRVQKSAERITELLMRGEDADGNLWSVDNKSFMKNGRRFLPIMGEFHFSRWEPEDWESAVRKMRAGGVEILATYVFWIHHEEREGEFDFTGCRDIRRFLEVCRKERMPVWLRIGPWDHGECRNGGFPDWLLSWAKETGAELRSDDPGYLAYVKRFWARLAGECAGEMCGDGGPVLGIQLENEYGHVGGTHDGKEGAAHMLTLKKLARELGFVTPFYTATGWGGAHVVDGETLPVLGGYVDAPWEQNVEEIPASEVFLFSPYHNDANIGSDAELSENGFRFSIERNPYLTAELGAGLQVTGHRRTYPYPADVEACALCMLGSGANLIGYYMYHGGINPDGLDQTLEEVPGEMGYNHLPKKSYDFQTCIRESGEIGASFGALKKLHLFTADFGEALAGMETALPEKLPASPEDMETLRVSVRVDSESGEGFLFVNNHQRRRTMKRHRDGTVRIALPEREILVEHLTVESGACGIIPFGIAVGELRLLRTNAWLLCRLDGRLVFYTDANDRAALYFDWSDGQTHDERLILLTRDEANRAFRVGNALYLTERADSCILEERAQRSGECGAEDGSGVCLTLLTKAPGERLTIVRADGSRETVTAKPRVCAGDGESSHEPYSTAAPPLPINAKCIGEEREEQDRLLWREYEVDIDIYPTDTFSQVYLEADYRGDRAEVYLDGKLVDDWFTTGEPWHIALKRFGYPDRLVFRIYDSDNLLSLDLGDHVYYDLETEAGCALDAVRLIPEYRIPLAEAEKENI